MAAAASSWQLVVAKAFQQMSKYNCDKNRLSFDSVTQKPAILFRSNRQTKIKLINAGIFIPLRYLLIFLDRPYSTAVKSGYLDVLKHSTCITPVPECKVMFIKHRL